jgi:chromosome partitioning protein
MTHIYTIVNQKGGVGKTTTAINLGTYLGHYNQNVLIVDMDSQANATSCLGVDKHTIKSGVYEVLIGATSIGPQILRNPHYKISLLPASPSLAGAEIELIDLPNRESRLKDALAAISGRYQYIIIDCPPSLSLLTINALVAAQGGVIIPVQCEYLALEGLGQLTQTLDKVRSSLVPDLKVRGVVLTMFDGRTKLSNDVVSEVHRFFPDQVLKSIIPRSVRLAEAPSYGQPISIYAPDSHAAKSYDALAREILEQDGIAIPANS